MDTGTKIKRCTKCDITKNITEFRKQKKGKYGVMSICKICQSEIEKNNRINGNSTSVERSKRFRENNPDKIKVWLKDYSDKNKDKRKEYDKKYNKDNRDLKNKQSRDYYLKNPHIATWRGILKSQLRRISKTKDGKTIDLLGYSALELKEHIESQFTEGMSWDNHGEWEVDHIKPVSSFDKDIHPSIVNALSNLQPLWWEENRVKGNVY
jgi:hypothetical protein